MKYDYDKPTSCDYFADVQVGDKVVVNLVDGSRIVGRPTSKTANYVHVRSSAMTGVSIFGRRDANIESVELLERNFVPGLYFSDSTTLLYRIFNDGTVKTVTASGSGKWVGSFDNPWYVMNNSTRIGD